MSELETPKPGGVSRRTVAKAMAWAVPAVAIAAPVPAYAGASQDFVSFTGNACKEPGGQMKYYYFELKITNSSITSLKIDFVSMEVNGVNGTFFDPSTYTVPAYTECIITVKVGQYPDSGNGTAYLTYEANDVVQPVINSISVLDPDQLNNLPPIDNQQQCTTTYPKEVCTALPH